MFNWEEVLKIFMNLLLVLDFENSYYWLCGIYCVTYPLHYSIWLIESVFRRHLISSVCHACKSIMLMSCWILFIILSNTSRLSFNDF